MRNNGIRRTCFLVPFVVGIVSSFAFAANGASRIAAVSKGVINLMGPVDQTFDSLTLDNVRIKTNGFPLRIVVREKFIAIGHNEIYSFDEDGSPSKKPKGKSGEPGLGFPPGPDSEGPGPGIDGPAGKSGQRGAPGNDGTDGKAPGILRMELPALSSGQLVIENRGMRGGDGADGGDGGIGGSGGQGGRAVPNQIQLLFGQRVTVGCQRGPGMGGPGGAGGDGGPGGAGGKGGGGGPVVVRVATPGFLSKWFSDHVDLDIRVSAPGGDAGRPGNGGSGGAGGVGGFGGRGATGCEGRELDRRGPDGSKGAAGPVGRVEAVAVAAGKIETSGLPNSASRPRN